MIVIPSHVLDTGRLVQHGLELLVGNYSLDFRIDQGAFFPGAFALLSGAGRLAPGFGARGAGQRKGVAVVGKSEGHFGCGKAGAPEKVEG